MSIKYIETTTVAKLIRGHLKTAFSSIKFSVRSHKYAGGSSIDVGWTDGPTAEAVEKVIKAFAGGRFEGMTDCSYGASSWYCSEHGARVAETYGCDVSVNNGVHDSRCCHRAELVHFGADHVFANRELSEGFAAELASAVRSESGLSADADLETYLPESSPFHHGRFDTLRDGVHRLARNTAGV